MRLLQHATSNNLYIGTTIYEISMILSLIFDLNIIVHYAKMV